MIGLLVMVLASVGLLLASVSAASAEPGGVPFTVELTGEAEVNAAGEPNQGDPDGSGTASLTINPGLEEVCWTIEVAGVAPITGAHIHLAPATASGPIVVDFKVVGFDLYEDGCTPVSRDLALKIILDPSAYYVNVHNADYPAGALRGQLDR